MSIGSAMDELVRHHPSLKSLVFSSLVATLKQIEDLGNSYVPPEDLRQWYSLSITTTPVLKSEPDAVMEDVRSTSVDAEAGNAAASGTDDEMTEDQTVKSHDNLVVNFIDVTGRVCFQCLNLLDF